MAIALNIPSQIEKYLSLSLFPATGNDFTLYIANNTNRLYQWDGSAYVEVSQQDAVNWGSIGGDILNQTDLQLALAGKEPTIAAGTTSQYFRGDKTFQTLDKSAVGLANVDNTSDANKPISTATQTALNAKQNSLGYTPVPETRTLTINGTTQDLSADRTFTISTGITIGTTAITSGTVGRVLFEGTGNVVQESANLTWDNTNSRLALNGTLGKLMFPSPEISFGSRFNGIHFTDSTYATSYGYLSLSSGFGEFRMFAASSYFPTFYSNGAERMRIFTTGNIGINTTTDAGFRLDVNGTARVQGNAQFGTGFYWDNTNNRLGIGTSSPSRILEIAGSAPVVRISGNTVTFAGIQMTNNGGDFWVGRDNSGGSSFGLNSPAYSGVINARGSYPLLLGAADKTAIYVFPTTTNVHIGAGTTIPTDAGFRLDVNGTARVQGTFEVANNGGLRLRATGGGASTSFRSSGNSAEIRTNDASVACMFFNQNGVVGFSQQVAFGNTSVSSASAQVQIDSTTKGFLPPRLTTTEKNAIASPATGLQVFDTTLNQMSYYNGTTWTNI